MYNQNPFYNQFTPYGMNYQGVNNMTNSGQSLIRVNGVDGAKNYNIGFNSTAALFDANEDIFYIKSTDATGFPSAMRAFRFAEIDVNSLGSNGVSRAEYNNLLMQINDIKNMLANQSKPTEVIQNNAE